MFRGYRFVINQLLVVHLTVGISFLAGCGGDKLPEPPPKPPGLPELPPAGGSAGESPVVEGNPASLTKSWNSDEAIPWQAVDVLAGLAKAAYLEPDEASEKFNELGFSEVTPNIDGSTVSYLVREGPVMVVVFRGTDDSEDWLVNLNIQTRDVEGGVMHVGFYDAFATVRPKIDAAIEEHPPEHLWITGHSLGGALSVVCAHQLAVADVSVDGVVTFGQPMVADEELANHLGEHFDGKYLRFVNNADIVPRVPPTFVHAGALAWFRDDGLQRAEFAGAARANGESRGAAPPGPPPLDEAQFEELKQKLREAREKRPKVAAGPEGPPKGIGLPFVDDHSMDRYVERVVERGAPSESAGAGPPELPFSEVKPEPGESKPKLPKPKRPQAKGADDKPFPGPPGGGPPRRGPGPPFP